MTVLTCMLDLAREALSSGILKDALGFEWFLFSCSCLRPQTKTAHHSIKHIARNLHTRILVSAPAFLMSASPSPSQKQAAWYPHKEKRIVNIYR